MRKKKYRLPAYPKRTIREKQGSHGDLSICRLDYTRTERKVFASQIARKNMRIKEKMVAWEQRSCAPQECSVAIEKRRHLLPTCREISNCSWAQYKNYTAL